MNSLLLTDGYKLLHHQMYPEDTTMIYSNWTPRKNNYGPKNSKGVVVVGVQYAIQYLVEHFNDNFFNKDRAEVLDELKTELSLYTGVEDFDVAHFAELYDLGHLPLMIKALPEGSICPFGVPCLTIRNTKPEFFWLTNYLETILSSLLWKMMTNATIALEYKRILLNACKETDIDNVGFVSYQAHDFSLRGLSGLSAGEQAGMAHAFVFEGSDNIPCISSLRKYYNAKGYIVGGVPATEHSIMSMGTKEDEVGTFRRLLKIYPKGLLSVVSDTWNLWDVLTKYLPTLKDEILSRDGKLVIRPDCLDDKSKILTPKGWKYFKDLVETDLVAQVKEDGTYEFVNPIEIINEPYEGDMYEIRDFYGKIDLLVTPNHRLVSYKNLDNSISIKEASEYKQNYWEYKKLRSPKSQSKGKELTFYERFLIALQADGCIKYVNKDLSTRVEFNFQKERKHDRLLEILKNTDLEYSVYFPKSRKGQSTFSVLIPYNKIISKTFDWVTTSDLDSLWSEQFIDELKHWDSSIRNGGRFKYDTTIKENIDIVELVAISAGKGIYISEAEDNRKEHFSKVYTAHILDNAYVGGQSITKTKIQYKGTIHCVKVPTGMILVKRNQGVCITGNSGNPVDIVCGTIKGLKSNSDTKDLYRPEEKGVIELLWDTFGGTINSQGYKVLDPHIGAIYGDSITLERAAEICDRLKAKGFASTNIVLGVGSYTYQYNTRDTFGFAMKATYGELEHTITDWHPEQSVEATEPAQWTELETREIYKDPITDDGTKKSAKGLIMVTKDEEGNFTLKDRCNWIQESGGELKTIFLNGVITREDFSVIRGRINSIDI